MKENENWHHAYYTPELCKQLQEKKKEELGEGHHAYYYPKTF